MPNLFTRLYSLSFPQHRLHLLDLPPLAFDDAVGCITQLPDPGVADAGQCTAALRALRRASTAKDKANLARFGITVSKAYGVSMASIQRIAKGLGRDYDLALAPWNTGWYEARDAAARLAWPHSGFHVHDAVLVPDGDTAFALRLARYCARNPVALERLAYAAAARQVRYRSDKTDGPTAGTETVDPLEFLARVTAHIPRKHQGMTRYYGYYANRVRGARRRRGAAPEGPIPVAAPVPLALREARR